MADVKPLKLVDQGGGAARLAEFEAGDTLPKGALPPLSAADVGGVAADDPRLSDAREWSAETVAQAEAEGGTATTRRAWTAQRVRQAIVAWWSGVSSAWSRGFVSSADAAAGRTALELGNAATATVQTSPTDTTAGRLMAVGAFGLGGRTPLYAGNIDLPADVPKGWVFCASPNGTTGTLPTEYGILWSGGIADDGFAQEWYEVNTGATTKRRYYRTIYNGVLGPWRELFHTGNILGTVSQSGGVPSGAIIERGSNANGEYVRFADGTQICWIASRQTNVTWQQEGGVFRAESPQWQFPAAFASLKSFSAFSVSNGPHWGTTGNLVNTSVVPTFYSAMVGTTLNYEFLQAEGFWY